MPPRKNRNREIHRKEPPIVTTFIDLLEVLTKLTKDDRVVLAVVKSIFQSHDVRLAHSTVPVRLVDARFTMGKNLRAGLKRKRSVWT